MFYTPFGTHLSLLGLFPVREANVSSESISDRNSEAKLNKSKFSCGEQMQYRSVAQRAAAKQRGARADGRRSDIGGWVPFRGRSASLRMKMRFSTAYAPGTEKVLQTRNIPILFSK